MKTKWYVMRVTSLEAVEVPAGQDPAVYYENNISKDWKELIPSEPTRPDIEHLTKVCNKIHKYEEKENGA